MPDLLSNILGLMLKKVRHSTDKLNHVYLKFFFCGGDQGGISLINKTLQNEKKIIEQKLKHFAQIHRNTLYGQMPIGIFVDIHLRICVSYTFNTLFPLTSQKKFEIRHFMSNRHYKNTSVVSQILLTIYVPLYIFSFYGVWALRNDATPALNGTKEQALLGTVPM